VGGDDVNQMRLVEQRKVDHILESIREDIEETKRMMEKPYTADDDDRYEKASILIRLRLDEAFTLVMIGIEEAYEYEEAIRDCNNELFAWRWPHDKNN
jgi:hypothetical protein